MTRVAVMGAGSWGTVFSMILSDGGCDVTLWSRTSDIADEMNASHTNEAYHPGVVFPSTIVSTTDARAALAGSDLVVLAVPAQTLRENLSQWRDDIPATAVIVSLIKGIEIGT